MKQKQTCRICGCTDDNCRACVEKTGAPCFWIEDNLCSACLNEAYPDENLVPTNTITNLKGALAFMKFQYLVNRLEQGNI
jgi:hypothetical protein